ncbi:MAG: hypothetical protein FWC78_04335 [Defluviitaleaceae bacterium]|nr:hypothetical protein [Defluviitaleaceae bacterium]
MNNPFTNKNLRSFFDHGEKKWWFSAVDICAILIESDYDTAREYWKKFKYDYTQQKFQLVGFSDQLKFPSPDGKYYFTDAIGITEAIYLIQIIPSPKAEPYRLWLANFVASDTNIEEILAAAGEERRQQIKEAYKNNPEKLAQRQVIKKERLV